MRTGGNTRSWRHMRHKFTLHSDTDQLTPACPVAMVLSHGVLHKLIYIHPLDEASLLLSMSHKGRKCENSYWSIMVDLHLCSVWWLQEPVYTAPREVEPPRQQVWACSPMSLGSVCCFLHSCISNTSHLFKNWQRHRDAILYLKKKKVLWCLESVWSSLAEEGALRRVMKSRPTPGNRARYYFQKEIH